MGKVPLLAAIAFSYVVRAQKVVFSTVAANAYGAGDVNSCAIALNNLTTVGSFRFMAYYDTGNNIVLARRTLGSTAWQTYGTGFSVLASEITDDHNVIALAIDSTGFLHMSLKTAA